MDDLSPEELGAFAGVILSLWIIITLVAWATGIGSGNDFGGSIGCGCCATIFLIPAMAGSLGAEVSSSSMGGMTTMAEQNRKNLYKDICQNCGSTVGLFYQYSVCNIKLCGKCGGGVGACPNCNKPGCWNIMR